MQNGFQTVNLQGCASGVIATPAIGENGNWWIGNTDTGISASGISGSKGDQGEPGPAGPKGDDGVAADMSRVEALEKQVAELNRDYGIISTEEHIIGTWIDGNPIYEITQYHTWSGAGEKTLNHGIANVDKIWFNKSKCLLSNVADFTNTIGEDSDWGQWFHLANKTAFYMYNSTGSARTIYAYITFNYTKLA